MACGLFGTKPLPGPKPNCQLDPQEQILMKYQWKCKSSLARKWIKKMNKYLRPFCSGLHVLIHTNILQIHTDMLLKVTRNLIMIFCYPINNWVIFFIIFLNVILVSWDVCSKPCVFDGSISVQWIHVPNQHCVYWWLGALAPGHQYSQWWLCTHAFPAIHILCHENRLYSDQFFIYLQMMIYLKSDDDWLVFKHLEFTP